MKAVVSNGFGQFHLRGLAESLFERDSLALFVSGTLPPRGRTGALLKHAGSAGRRLGERSVALPEDIVQAVYAPEIPHQVSQRMRSGKHFRLADRFEEASFRAYSASAQRAVTNIDFADIYHYRAGYGGRSIERARARGMAVLCDHSIVAPRAIDRYVPQAAPTKLMPRMWKAIERDIVSGDGVLANSDFVAETFAEVGFDPSNVFVAYTPVDPVFSALLDELGAPREEIPTVTFAGTAEYRKGIDLVVQVAKRVKSSRIKFRIIGDWAPDAISLRRELPSNVVVESKLPRLELAAALARTDVFLFPSRAEGSARVVAEALRAGCQVVTTRSAGSAARDLVDGYVLHDAEDLDGMVSAVDALVRQDVDVRTARMENTRANFARRLSPDRYASDVIDAYERMAARR